jgi:hypothetical protein
VFIISKTSVNLYQTTPRNIAQDSNFHTRRRENLQSDRLLYCVAPALERGAAFVQKYY